jgi:beta-glucosidase
MSGRPLAVGWLDREAPAILAAWFGGTQAGHAMADVLFGDYNPSGRLPVSFPRHVGQVPVYYAHKPTGRPAGPAHYTSKYLDVPNEPLYPFGYGLSYTTFAYSDVRLSAAEMTADGSLEVSVEVENTGRVAGEETVQLYVRDLVGSVTRPVRELKSFRKVALGPGERRTVAFTLTPARDLAFLRRDMTVGVEPGRFEVFVGPDSATANRAGFMLLPSQS